MHESANRFVTFGGLMEDKSSRDMILWFFLVLFLISALLLGWLLWPFVSIIVMAFVVTGVFNPIYGALTARIKPQPASLLTCVVIFIVLFVPIVLFVGILSKEAYGLYLLGKGALINDRIKSLLAGSSILDRVNLLLTNFHVQITSDHLNRILSEISKAVGMFVYDQASAIASNVFAFIVNFFFMLLITYFMLIDGHKVIAFITQLSPLPKEQDDKLIRKFKDMSGAILVGNGLGGLIQGVSGGLVFALFGLESPFLWGVVMALLAFLPIVGIGVVFIPATVYLFLTDRFAAGVFFVVFYVILSGGVEYILKPKLVGKRVKMHTLLVFISIIGGLKLFGILGIIYGPLVATGFLTLTDIYHTSYQQLVTPIKN
ncbi:MAG: AI-2E family transporter [Thermodesulfobacteriota bacterium]